MSEDLPLNPKDFSAYYAFAPAALALRECIRLQAVRRLELPGPILDVGCGDGLFARLAYPERQTWGIDINPSEVQRAQATSAYKTLICGSIVDVDLPRAFFNCAIANCSLEHVPDLRGALLNIRRALKPRAKFVLIVPTPDWTERLAIPRVLAGVGLQNAAAAYGNALDRVFSHVHLYDSEGWRSRLEDAGFTDVSCDPIVEPASSWAFDVMLYPSLVGYVTKRMTGRWVAIPGLRALSANWSREFINFLGSVAPKDGGPAEYLISCRAPDESNP